LISKPLKRSLKEKKIGISFLGVTLEGSKETSIESQKVQEGIKFLKKENKSNNRSIQEEGEKHQFIVLSPRATRVIQKTHTGASKKKVVRQRISAMGERKKESRQKK